MEDQDRLSQADSDSNSNSGPSPPDAFEASGKSSQ